jgi:hypothetical protein
MASIVGKKQGDKTYYYLVESARVGGRPRIVSQRYLGPAEEIMARLSGGGPGEPDRTRHLAFGDLAAVWSMLGRLRVAQIVDAVVGARRADAAASVGTYVALAVANRIVDPRSKRQFSDWWQKTCGDRLVKVPASALDHRRFWDAMDVISDEQLEQIERGIVTGAVEEYSIDLAGLVLDMANFATYIDSGNERASMAQRGHANPPPTTRRRHRPLRWSQSPALRRTGQGHRHHLLALDNRLGICFDNPARQAPRITRITAHWG